MLKKTKKWIKCKNIDSKRYKRDLANYLDGRSIKCVTERRDGIEEVVGKSGAIIKKDDELLIYSSQDVLMRMKRRPSRVGAYVSRGSCNNGARHRTQRRRAHGYRVLQLLETA